MDQSELNEMLFQQKDLHAEQIAANKAAITAVMLALCDDSELMAAKLTLYLKVAATLEKSYRFDSGMMDDGTERYFDSSIASFESVLQDYKAIKKQLGR
jgi:hypothetical protein